MGSIVHVLNFEISYFPHMQLLLCHPRIS